MNSNLINTIFDWCVNFLMNVATAIGTSYEALNVDFCNYHPGSNGYFNTYEFVFYLEISQA